MTNGPDATRVRFTPGNWLGLIAVILTALGGVSGIARCSFPSRAETIAADARIEAKADAAVMALGSHQALQAQADKNLSDILTGLRDQVKDQGEIQAVMSENQIRFNAAIGLPDIRRPKRGAPK